MFSARCSTLISACVAAFVLLAGATAHAAGEPMAAPQSGHQTGKILEKTHGPWRATCFVDATSPQPYCRVMVVHFFNTSGKNLDFAQFGPSFDRGEMGFVVATYYGFANESRITVGIDDNDPINMPAPLQGNHIAAPTNITEVLVDQMMTGKAITVEFNMLMRGKKTLSYPLDGFRELKASIDKVLAGG